MANPPEFRTFFRERMTPLATDSRSSSPSPVDPVAVDIDALGHPRGTLAVVLVFGALFALGWFAFYLLRFMERGALHH